MPPKKRRTPSTNGNIERFFKKTEVRENAGANREEVGEEGVPGGGVTGGGVTGGGVTGGGVTGGRVTGGGVPGGGVTGGGVRGGGVPGGGVPGGGVPGGGVRGGGSQENPDATQEETAGGERTSNLPDTPSVNPDTPSVNPDTPSVNPDTPSVNPGTPCVKQEEMEEEQHGHTIYWKYDKEKKKYRCYCNKAGTIYESLQRFPKFQELEQKSAKADPKKKKELVILISVRTAISSHFPCSHIPTENLTIKFINAKDNQTTTESIKIENPGEIIRFSIKTSGTTNIRKVVMKNLELKEIVDEVLVYGYKGQTVREALEQDGRFNDEVLQSNYFLEDTKDGNLTEMSSPVDVLHEKCFSVRRIGKNGTKQEAKSSRTASPKGNQPTPNPSKQPNPSDQPTPDQSNQPTPDQSNQPTPNKSSQVSIYQPIPNSEDLLQLLRSQFKDLVKQMKERQNLTPIAYRNLLSQEFGKSTKFCHEVRAMRRFLELGNSVCQVRIDASAAGSGFLLFGKYILTNGHVVLDEAKHPREKITVIFSYEELTDSQLMDVKVVASELCDDAAGHKHDWALLEVCDDLNAQPIKAKPLLKDFGLVTERGQICIIGHPDGKVKMMDPCFTIPLSEREIFVTGNYFSPNPMDRKIHTYESCFYGGSSGSPVFDHNYKVVSMHTGGFPVGQTQGYVLEFSLPLSLIIEQIIIQIVREKKVHVLLAMITCVIHPVVKDNIKKIVELNPTEFVWTEDEMINLTESFSEIDKAQLKGFLGFFSQRDEPMDTSS
ncbi:serine protease FAM111A-like isoform X4 [Gadus macrocephalus]|uniref:serine protease FAM111A-like isoform X4 n=1 Tax=Gadus macrocephalus TaxID=80720 RepID=UPI0028CBB14E|nr:serine protease FAM111A-like isoform X4 [Gadus macrocephalus]